MCLLSDQGMVCWVLSDHFLGIVYQDSRSCLWESCGIMQQKLTVAPLASARYVYSRLTIYYSSKVDVRWQRSVHYCPVCDVPALNDLKLTCGAIHYGWCSAPPFPSKPPLAPGCQRVNISYPRKVGTDMVGWGRNSNKKKYLGFVYAFYYEEI